MGGFPQSNRRYCMFQCLGYFDSALFALASFLLFSICGSAATLIHRYSFESDARDSVGNASGVIAGNATVTNGVLRMDGKTGGIQVSSLNLSDLKSMSIEAWFVDEKKSLDIAKPTTVYEFNGTNGGARFVYQLSRTLELCAGAYSVLASNQYVSARNPQPGKVLHFLWTQDADAATARVYFDGALFSQNPNFIFTPNRIGVTTNNWIGRSAAEGGIQGQLLEFRIYDGALTPEEAAVSYRIGPEKTNANFGNLLGIRLALPTQVGPGASLVPLVLGDWQDLTNVPLTDLPGLNITSDNPDIVSITTLTNQLYTNSPTTTSIPLFTTSQRIRTKAIGTANLSASYGLLSHSAQLNVTPPSDVSLIHRYSFIETADSGVLHDSVGQAHGRVVSTASPVGGFSGRGELSSPALANLPRGLISSLSEVSFEAWVVPTNYFYNWTRIFDFGDRYRFNGNTWGKAYFFLTPLSGSDFSPFKPLLRAAVTRTTNSAELPRLDWTNGLPLNVTSHVAVTYSPYRKTSRLYVNGSLVATNVAPVELGDLSDENNWLGKSQFSLDADFSGRFDEFRIYSGFLTDDQVAASYAVGPNVGVSISQMIQFSLPSELIATNAPISLTATASSGLPVKFSVISGPGFVSNDRLILGGDGTLIVRAEQPGDAVFTPILSDVTVTVRRADQLITWNSQSEKISAVNVPYPLIAGTSASLPVSFRVESGPAFMQGTNLTVTNYGAVTVVAEQLGSAYVIPALPVRQTYVVPKVTVIPSQSWPGYQRSGMSVSLQVVGDRVYLATSTEGLRIVDVSNPALPKVLGQFRDGTNVDGVKVVGNLAYVAHGNAGLTILDVTDPAHIPQIGRFQTAGFPLRVDVVNSMAYVADEAGGFAIIDVSNPANPTLKSKTTLNGSVTTVQANGVTNVFATAGSNCEILNVSNPSNPVRVRSITPSAAPHSLDVSGTFLYLADGAAGLDVYNIADLTAPNKTGNYDTSGECYAVRVRDGIAYVADGGSGMPIINVSNPTNLTKIGFQQLRGTAVDVQLAGDFAYVATKTSGMAIVNIHNPAAPVLVGELDLSGFTRNVQIVSNSVFAADGLNGLIRFSTTNSGAAIMVGERYISTPVDEVFVYRQHLYTLISALSSVVSQGINPPVDYFAYTSGSASFDVGDTFAAMATGTAGFTTLDMSVSGTLPGLGPTDTPGNAYAVRVRNELTYVADGASGIAVYDTATKRIRAARLGGYDTPGTSYGLQVVSNLVYVGDGTNGLQIINASNPTNLVRVGGIVTNSDARAVELLGNYAFVANGSNGMQVINVSLPSKPVLIASFDTPGIATGIAVATNRIFVADGAYGVQVFDWGIVSPPPLFSFQSVSMLGDGNLNLKVSDAAGLTLILESSTDLRSWISMRTNYFTNSIADWFAPRDTRLGGSYYRARLVP